MSQNLRIAIEPFTEALAREIAPLGQKCWQESTAVKGETCAFYGARDFLIEPDTEQYQRLHDQQALLVLTLRDAGRLVGYGVGILYRALHHRNVTVGGGDTFYIEPGYRAYTGPAVEHFERALREAGAAIIGWPTHIDGPLHAVLKARGYVGDDIVMEKRLCAS